MEAVKNGSPEAKDAAKQKAVSAAAKAKAKKDEEDGWETVTRKKAAKPKTN